MWGFIWSEQGRGWQKRTEHFKLMRFMSICNHVADHLGGKKPKPQSCRDNWECETVSVNQARVGGGGGRTELNLAITTGEGDRGLHAQVLIFDKRSNKEPMLRLRSSWTGCQLCFRLEQSSKPGLYTYEPWQALFRASLACSLTVRIKKKQDREC